MNVKEAHEIIDSYIPRRTHTRGRAEGWLECLEQMKPLVEWIESLGIKSKKDILNYYKKEVLGEK